MEPITRSEQYLASILGEDVVLPIPQSRIEYYLNAIAQNGIAPSSAGLINYDPDASYPDGSIGKEVHTLDGDVDTLKSQIAEVESSYPQKSASGSIVTIDDGADNVPVVSLTAQIVPIQSGTGDPSPDNVRPISGWTGANVFDTGVNIFNEEWEEGKYWDATDGQKKSGVNWKCSDYIPCAPETIYFIYKSTSMTGSMGYLCFYDGAKNYLGYEHTTADNISFTTPANAKYMTIYASKILTDLKVSINTPSTDHSYHAYTGRTVPISWETEAGTVYGGSLSSNGKVTASQKSVTFVGASGESWSYTSNYSALVDRASISISDALTGEGNQEIISNLLTFTTGDSTPWTGKTNNNGVLLVYLPVGSFADAAAWKAFLASNNLQIVYNITPVVYEVDPAVIKTLYGFNNLWGDTGDIDVTYRADPATYTAESIRLMLNAMVATVEPTTTASKAYNVNDFLIMDGTLYKVIANIASGGTITPNTNVSATTVGEQLTAILNS